MTWRRLGAIAIAILLPLPLVIAGSFTRRWEHHASAPSGEAVSPVLSRGERRKLLSFQRLCKSSEECDPPLACLNVDGGGYSLCVDSECMTDQQCKEGFACRILRSLGRGPHVRSCVPVGKATEGTLCVEAPGRHEGSCLPGLICAGWCGRSCRLDEPSSCPPGSFCADSLNGPLCLPSCTADSCPSDQQCIRSGEGVSFCAIVPGENCQRAACPKGRECTFSYSPGENRVWMECIIPCEAEAPACPEGTLCFAGACRRPCDQAGAESCEPGDRCVELPLEKRSLCMARKDR